MPIRTQMGRLTSDEAKVAFIDKFERRVSAEFPEVLEGWHLTVIVVKTPNVLDDADMDALETQVTAIAGVQATRVMSQNHDDGVPNLPVTHTATLVTEMGYRVVPV